MMAKRGAEIEDEHQQETANFGDFQARQGPFPPWCVGSSFSPPQLITSDLCPLIFNQVGKPECILSTGQEVELQEATALKTSEQTKSFMLSTSAPFIPSGLLQDHLEEDAALHEADSNLKKLCHGNRLESVKCSDGNIILFFPCGKFGEKIGCSLCYPKVDGEWYPIRKSSTAADCDDLDEAHCSVSPSFSERVLQLSAVMVQPDVDGHGYVYVAARTYYQVHFCIVLREVERIRFVSTYAATFQTYLSHVTWNPHLDREAAVLLQNGEVSLFDVPIYKPGHTNRMMDLRAKLTLENPARTLRTKSQRNHVVSSQALVVFEARHEQDHPNDDLDAVGSLDVVWRQCEFAWHPQILLVSGLRKVVQMDYRGNRLLESSVRGTGCLNGKFSCDTSVVADVGVASAVSRFCSMTSKEEHILAFARAEYDGMCKFSVATGKHLMLFDARRVGAPVLQWEHGMTEEPPDLLIMLQASALQSSVDERKRGNHQNGRVILAVSFQSGDIRLFFYGSKGSRESSKRKQCSTMEDFEGHDWDDVTFAWEMPLKIYPPKAVANDWNDLLSLSDVRFRRKSQGAVEPKGLECIAGIILLSHQSSERSASISKRAFTMLQLTGTGDILLQQYKASDQSMILPSFRLDSVSGLQDKEEVWESQRPRFLVLGAFFKYMRTGSTLLCSSADKKRKLWGRTQGAGRLGDDNNLDKDATKVSKPSGLKKEVNLKDSHFKAQLKTVLEHLSVPLSMIEVTHTVLRMGLPSSLLPLAARLPSDLESQRQRGYNLRSFLPLIYSGPPSESADQVIVGNCVKPIPLSPVLEIQEWSTLESSPLTKNDCNNGHLKVCGNGVAGASEVEEAEGCNIASAEQFGSCNEILSGHKLLLEACSQVEQSLIELVEKQVPSIVSSSDRKEDWNEPEVGNQILLYEISTDIFSMADRGLNSTFLEKVQNAYNVAESYKELGSLSQESLCKFVAGKSVTSQGKDQEDRFTNMDMETCPIKLSYTGRTEGGPLEAQLEEQEWTALKSLQAHLRDWQQSFKPYSGLYG